MQKYVNNQFFMRIITGIKDVWIKEFEYVSNTDLSNKIIINEYISQDVTPLNSDFYTETVKNVIDRCSTILNFVKYYFPVFADVQINLQDVFKSIINYSVTDFAAARLMSRGFIASTYANMLKFQKKAELLGFSIQDAFKLKDLIDERIE